MFLILEDYFKNHPIKAKIVREFYNLGISVVGQKLYFSDMELSIGEVSKKLNVNRRTVYETISVISQNKEIREIMSRIRPSTDLGSVFPLFGGGIVSIEIPKGKFSFVFDGTMKAIQKYSFYVREIKADNCLEGPSIRIILHKDAPKMVYRDIANIPGVKSVLIETQENLNGIICNRCKVKLCSEKFSSPLSEEGEFATKVHDLQSEEV